MKGNYLVRYYGDVLRRLAETKSCKLKYLIAEILEVCNIMALPVTKRYESFMIAFFIDSEMNDICNTNAFLVMPKFPRKVKSIYCGNEVSI